jgi:hypothetical protein
MAWHPTSLSGYVVVLSTGEFPLLTEGEILATAGLL